MVKAESIEIPDEYNYNVVNGSKGRNPLSIAGKTYREMVAYMVAIEPEFNPRKEAKLNDALTLISEWQDENAERITAQAETRKVTNTASNAVAKMTPEQLMAFAKSLGFVTA